MRFEHTTERGFAGKVDALIGEHGHGAKAHLIGHAQELGGHLRVSSPCPEMPKIRQFINTAGDLKKHLANFLLIG